MILKDGNNPYVLLNEQDNQNLFWLNLGEAIPSQLSDNYLFKVGILFLPTNRTYMAKMPLYLVITFGLTDGIYIHYSLYLF